MNIYALFPLTAIIAYIPLLLATASSRPWQRRHRLFILFLIPAIMWSLTDYLLRSNLYPQYNFLLLQLIVITFALTVVQFHCFTSSFFGPGQGRWLPLAYISLAVVIILVLLGYVPEGVVADGDKLYLSYGRGIIFIAIPLLILVARNFYVFGKRLRVLDSPALYNQIVSLMLGISVLTIFTLVALLPWGRQYPVSHFGNLINAFILSYATVRHQLVDIRIVLRQGTALVSLGVIGVVSYWMVLTVLHSVFQFQLDLVASFVASLVGVVVAAFVYRLRGSLFEVMSRVFQGQSYDYRQRLSDFAKTIHNIFSLEEQGGELLALGTKAIGSKQACLLFPDAGSKYFTAHFIEPNDKSNYLSDLKLKEDSPIVRYLGRQQKPLTRENLMVLPEFLSLWEEEKEEFKSREIEAFMPLISRDRLIAILVLGKKQSGRYSLEDFNLLEDVTSRVAVSMEKEYLREQLREREEELSVINRSSAIITSSLDIQEIYDSFIAEIKKVLDVSWAAIVTIEETGLYFLAASSDIHSDWQVGNRIPIEEEEDTATGWVITHQETIVEPDLLQESRFTTGKHHLSQGIRSVVYLPLMAKSEIIGTLTVASRQPNAYSQRHIRLLEQLASQIAMPVENARLYAKAEERARIDALTGLLNRHSLDEMIAGEINRHSRYGGVFSLAILDLDFFKVFNDSYGHLAGDKLLRRIGRTIKNAIRSSDQAFRYGGDEFAILLPQTTNEDAIPVTERVRQKIAFKVDESHIQIAASLGLASWPADGVSQNEIIAAADMALYRAKRSGGNQSQVASGNLLPFDSTVASLGSNEDSRTLSIIYTLAETVDTMSPYARNHAKRVTEYALSLAESLNLEPPEISRLETCAILHDVGKIGISDEILNKPGKLTAAEWQEVKAHPQLGAAIISRIPQLSHCVPGTLHHHERYDGSGYPKGLKGEDIPLDARILAIADAFAAMTSERAYAGALSHEDALEEIKKGAGKQFDPYLAENFLSIYGERLTASARKNARR